MGSQQLLEGLGLGLAQLREARGGVAHRAVMLAQLRTGIGIHRCRGVSVLSEAGCEECKSRACVGSRCDGRRVTCHEGARTLASECQDSGLTIGAVEVGQCRHSQVVVVDVEGMTSRVGEREDTRRATAATDRGRTEGTPLTRPDEALGSQGLKVPPDHRRGQPQAGSQLRRGSRPSVEEGPGDALGTGAGEFHTPSVSQIPRSATAGGALVSTGSSWEARVGVPTP